MFFYLSALFQLDLLIKNSFTFFNDKVPTNISHTMKLYVRKKISDLQLS